MKRKLFTMAAVAAVVSTTLVGGAGGAGAALEQCDGGAHPGGDWRQLNGALAGTREQPAEDKIDASNAGSLEKKWAFSVERGEGEGNFQSTATVANGCVYVGTTNGWIFALDADTGDLVWKTLTGGGPPGGHFALSVVDGRVHANISAPSALRSTALDAKTGDQLWVTDFLADSPLDGTVINSSPVVFNGMVLVSNSIATGPGTRVPYFLFDAETGNMLHRGYAIPEKDLEHGYSGGGIWSTAAVDEETGYAYVGTSDSESYTKQHAHNSAIIKIDLARARDADGAPILDAPTCEGTVPEGESREPLPACDNRDFGEVVDAYKGLTDTYVDGLDRQPACEAVGNDVNVGEYAPFACFEQDIDFGASVNLFVDEEGDKVVTANQKACVLHAVHADTMTQKWTQTLSRPAALGCAATAAVGDDKIFVSADPGNVWGLSSIGWIQWAAPTASATRYQPMTYANGVTYTVDNAGVLWAWDAETGLPVLSQPMSLDASDDAVASDACVTLSGGVSIARNRVFATCDLGSEGGGWLISYGLPE